MDNCTVTLTPYEMITARSIGRARNDAAVKKGLPDYEKRHLRGAPAEMAVAKHFGVYWHPNIGVLDQPDVEQTEVRCADSHDKNLIVKPENRPALPYILVTFEHSKPREFWLRGWIFGREAKQEKYWDQSLPDPGYLVPRADLKPMEVFPLEFIYSVQRFNYGVST